jgi:hypothetical protein
VILDPDVLDHLAHLARQRRKRWPSRLADPEATAEALADQLVAGALPALGWWRAQLAPGDAPAAPLCPPPVPLGPPEYGDIILFAEELAGIEARAEVALELLAEMVITAGLTADVLQAAYGLYEELS